jgi:hypothetical protein
LAAQLPRPVQAAAGAAALLLVVAAGLSAALTRHVHVDEFHNVYSMQLCGAFQVCAAADPVELYLVLGGLVTGLFETSAAMLVVLRVIFFSMWLGLFVAIATVATPQRRDVVTRGPALLIAVCFWPLWRHGFEVRHDVVLALGVVALIALAERARYAALPWHALAMGGAVAALMQVNAHKAATLWGPGLVVIGLLDARHVARGRGAWVARVMRGGAVFAVFLLLSLAMLLGLMGLLGALPAYLDGLAHFVDYAGAAVPFSGVRVWLEIVRTAPVVSALAVLGLLRAAHGLRHRRLDDSSVPALFSLLVALALFANPTPYPYNMTWMAPPLVLLAVPGAATAVAAVTRWAPQATARVVVVAAAFGLVAPLIGVRLADHWFRLDSTGQRAVMAAAEALTAPTDSVLDGVGLVPSRPPPSKDWILHSLFLPDQQGGERETFRAIIERDAPPVLIGGHYRFRWLNDADRRAIDAAYVPLSRQLYVLGGAFAGPLAEFHVRRAGRYRVRATDASVSAVTVDGVRHPSGSVVELPLGRRRVVVSHGGSEVLWLGPTLTEPPPLQSLPRLLGKPRLHHQR